MAFGDATPDHQPQQAPGPPGVPIQVVREEVRASEWPPAAEELDRDRRDFASREEWGGVG